MDEGRDLHGPEFPKFLFIHVSEGKGQGAAEEPALRDTSAQDKDARFPEQERFLNDDFLRGVARQCPSADMRARQLQHKCNQFSRAVPERWFLVI